MIVLLNRNIFKRWWIEIFLYGNWGQLSGKSESLVMGCSKKEKEFLLYGSWHYWYLLIYITLKRSSWISMYIWIKCLAFLMEKHLSKQMCLSRDLDRFVVGFVKSGRTSMRMGERGKVWICMRGGCCWCGFTSL